MCFKWIKDLTVRAKIINIVKENIGVNLHDPGVAIAFLDLTLKS